MKYFKWLGMMVLLLLTASCEKDVPSGNLKQIQFNATIEPLAGSADKVYLYNEEWVFWELGDQISIGSDLTTADAAPAGADLVNASPGSDFEDFNGVFVASLPMGSQYFLGLHPKRDNNRIISTGGSSFDVHIDLPAEQPRRPGNREDISFAKQIYPMVAWFGGLWDAEHPTPFNLDFLSLGCLVRVQLFNASTSDATIKDITFTSRDGSGNMQLSGVFAVGNYNVPEPYLTAKPSPTAAEKQVKLTFGSGMAFERDTLRTFYLVLPAVAGNGVTTTYKLEMTVRAEVSGVEKTFTKTFTAGTRRIGITNMRALGITDWKSTPSTSVGLAGCGTKDRPFKIYTVDDLVLLRDCYNGSRKINGQDITEDTYIQVMRRDIVLTTSNWYSSSIENFVGHFCDIASGDPSDDHGITNNSNIPIFQNVTSTGHIENLVVKSGATLTATASYLSPLCNVNEGEIKDCILRGTVSASFADLGGIAGQNRNGGQIIGCACDANMSVASGKHIGGICLDNISSPGHESIISACRVESSSASHSFSAAEVGGICHDNQGTIRDCLFLATITSGSDARWGGIVYNNSTSAGIVEYCLSNGSIISLGTVGGIAHTVSGGTVNYCWLTKNVKGSQVGGIAHTVNGGTVINCYVDNPTAQVQVDVSTGGTHIGGGIAAIVSGGEVKNSFVNNGSFSGAGAILGHFVGNLTGGVISNSYSYDESGTLKFYHTTSLAGAALNSALSVSTAPCYLVGNSQDGVTTVATPLTSDLTGYLNSHTPSGGVGWFGIPPILEPYTPSKRR